MPDLPLPSDPRLRVLVVAGVAALLVVLGLAVHHKLERRAELRALQALGDSVEFLRAAYEDCRYELGRQEVGFRSHDQRVDSLRSEVEAYESRNAEGERGVAAEEYDAYLETFDLYNLSVGEWKERADSLQARSRRCRETAVRHNVLADSLRARLGAFQAGEDGSGGTDRPDPAP